MVAFIVWGGFYAELPLMLANPAKGIEAVAADKRRGLPPNRVI